MKRFIGEIKVEDPVLACDIVQALENNPDSGRTYEVEMYDLEGIGRDPLREAPFGREVNGCRLKIFAVGIKL